MSDELLSYEQAAELVGIDDVGLRNLRRRGRGPRATVVAKRVWFARADVERWLAARADLREARALFALQCDRDPQSAYARREREAIAEAARERKAAR